MTVLEYNRIVWLYQEAYQQLVIKYISLYSSGAIPKILKRDLFKIKSILGILNRYQESEIISETNTLNYLTSDQVQIFIKVLNCYFTKYKIKYKLLDIRTSVVSQIPNNALLQENNQPILQENAEYILT